MPETQGVSTAGRWWEYYALRYFVGTVAGATALFYLTKFGDPPLRGLPPVEDLGKLGGVVALGALGFAFCYIASAPMLVIHTMRAQFGVGPLRPSLPFLAVSAATVFGFQLVTARLLSVGCLSLRWFGCLVFFVVVGAQVAVIVAAHKDRFRTIKSFYRDLARARARAGEMPPVAEYVESYRHLREHGNAYSILVLEAVLALVLVSAREPLAVTLAVTIWLLPSAHTWYVGSLLEASNDWRE